VDQGRGLEGLAGFFAGQPLRRQLAQLVVDERQELLGGARVALLDGRQDAGDIAHWWHRKGESLGGTTSPTSVRGSAAGLRVHLTR
jgi:hypothetical protein